MSSLDSLHDLLEEELRDLYDAEKQLTKALPKLAKKATSPDLKAGFEAHLQETEGHIGRLEQAFEQLGLPARGKSCKGMRNLISEGNAMIADAEEDATRDALMISAAQKVEHYEIAAYGTVRTWAKLLGKDDVASLLEETLDEEKATDQKLTEIAESHVNEAAAEEGEEDREPSRAMRAGTRQPKGSRRALTARTARQQAAERGSRSGGDRGSSRSRRSR
jgi:ferritin-like metal-binding protein YciE